MKKTMYNRHAIFCFTALRLLFFRSCSTCTQFVNFHDKILPLSAVYAEHSGTANSTDPVLPKDVSISTLFNVQLVSNKTKNNL